MKVLYLTTPEEDYLQDLVLIGLRNILGKDCIDYPKKDQLYKSTNKDDDELYGRGFTVWKELENINISRSNISKRISSGEFDAVIFSSIQRQINTFEEFLGRGNLNRDNTQYIFLDGEDFTPQLNSIQRLARKVWLTFRNAIIRDKSLEKVPQIGNPPYTKPLEPVFSPALAYGHYFKRELTSPIYRKYKSTNIHPISFGIPKQKIRDTKPTKNQRFPSQVQCEEAYKLSEVRRTATKDHLFTKETEYYDDLASSRYGITQMKGGWDCMRHYEIAANWTVPCFYNLDQKPELCAPHGLRDMYNCIMFTHAKELQNKIKYIDDHGMYEYLQKNAVDWIRANTAEQRAAEILQHIDRS